MDGHSGERVDSVVQCAEHFVSIRIRLRHEGNGGQDRESVLYALFRLMILLKSHLGRGFRQTSTRILLNVLQILLYVMICGFEKGRALLRNP